MERRFFLNEFEESLKEHANEFKMIPSKKVWHGIYNDMHPGRRWPSVAVSLLLIFTLVVVGHLNTHNGFRSTTTFSGTNELSNNKIQGKVPIALKSKKVGIKSIKNSADNLGTAPSLEISSNDSGANVAFTFPFENSIQTNDIPSDSFLSDNYNDIKKSNSSTQQYDLNSISNNSKGVTEADNPIELKKSFITEDNGGETLKEATIINTPGDISFINNETITKNTNIIAGSESPSKQNKIIKPRKKKNKNIAWMYYAAPVASNVSFKGQEIKEPPVNSFSPTLTVNSKPNKVLHNFAYGLEAGVQLNVNLAPKLKFTTGLQLTYSGYKIISNEVHPTFATLILKNPKTGNDYTSNYITHYGDGTGQAVVKLRNYSWQLSIPVGLQYEFYTSSKVQLNFAANIEPSMIVKSNAYILSSEGSNYVNDHALLRKWNASSNFGAFVSFTSIKFKWQIGPNIRYQWLSTYKKDYTVQEHLIDYGIRIGISK